MDSDEFGVVKELLLQVMASDNEVRREAESKLTQVRQANFDKYFAYMVTALADLEFDGNCRSIALILLRKDANESEQEGQGIWSKISQETRDYVKPLILEVLGRETNEMMLGRVAELSAQIAVSINLCDHNDIWPELFEHCKQMVSEGSPIQMKTGLTVYGKAVITMSEQIIQDHEIFYNMLEFALKNEDITVAFASLQVISQLLCVLLPRDVPKFVGLLETMVKVPMRALKEAEYQIFEESMEEFTSMVDSEPKFFKNNFSDLLQVFGSMFEESENLNEALKKLPIEILITIAEREPRLLSNNENHCKHLLDMIFKLMIGIDEEVTEEWLDPSDPSQAEEENENDIVTFGRNIIDRLFSSLGEEILLPLGCNIIQQAISNDGWKYKNAGLSVFSQIAEYVNDIEDISSMIPVVIQHCKHDHPKVRYAALHCLGQFATDLSLPFIETYHTTLIPMIYDVLDDRVNRVKAHACAAITNFFECAPQEIGLQYCNKLFDKLFILIKSKSSDVAACAISSIASLSESLHEDFIPYFKSLCDELLPVISQQVPNEFRKFKGQAIESLTIAASSIGADHFKPHFEKVARALILIQKEHLDQIDDDPQKIYILNAWQRLCMLMSKEFAPVMPELMPEIFKMSCLQPMTSKDSSSISICEHLEEVKNLSDESTTEIKTTPLEETKAGIGMLSTFIEELEELYAPYVEKTSELFLSLLNCKYDDEVRTRIANSLPLMISAIKSHQKGLEGVLPYTEKFIPVLLEVIKEEVDTTLLQTQFKSIESCIEATGDFMSGEQVNQIGNIFLEEIVKSDKRKDVNLEYAREIDEEVDGLENENEDELQIVLSEAIGMLFKTHKGKCSNIVANLFDNFLPSYLNDAASFTKQKLGIYIINDVVEHVGLEILEEKYEECFHAFVKCSKNENPTIRQAGVYGIGVTLARSCKVQLFGKYSVDAIQTLKEAIEIDCGSQDSTEYGYAKDNAISALVKVMKHHHQSIDVESTFEFLLQHIPLKYDLVEAKFVNDFLADVALSNPSLIIGKDNQNIKQFVVLLGQICREDQMEHETMKKFGKILKSLSSDSYPNDQITEALDNLDQTSQHRIQSIIDLSTP
ncbi:unnamed protein product [Moneuplotes crassus]|uniref:Importin N-terminal domain-containing protein n=1 Tax=Euplotes crassus TaxID=5936 RepID=A0AAD1UQ20_EUPCR|nr:unnamed protein product [Moneuplotes crassus]